VTAALAAALAAAADGIPPAAAGTGLLAASGAFLHRDDFTSRFIETAAGISDGTPMAWTDWDAVITALDEGRLPASSGEKAVLRLAASLASGSPVSLRDTVTSLDNRNLALVITAIRHAAGHH
jgi:hypothetical protein